jgi:hypothetical protein
MHRHLRKHLHFGLMAATLAGAFGCNSHQFAGPGAPQVTIVNPPPVDQQPPVEPGLPDAGRTPSPDAPVTVLPLSDGGIPDAAAVVPGADAAVVVGGPDAPILVGVPDAAAGREAGREAGPEVGPCLNSLPPRKFP